MDAFPLPAAPDLDRYRRLADQLRQARDDDRVRAWAADWLAELAGLLGREAGAELAAGIERAATHIERLVNGMADVPRTPAGAEEVVARLHAFASWERFADHLRELAIPTSQTARFERAADAAANGVEDFRQKTPGNIVDIARTLLDAGAEVDAPNADYGGDGAALGLVATSIHPEEAGVQLALMDLLVSAGASLEGLPGGWRPMDAAVANGCPEAAAWLADRGARVTLIAAAALGREEDVAREIEGAPAAEIAQAFDLACGYGRTRVAELFLDRGLDITTERASRALRLAAAWNHPDTVDMLLARGAIRR